MRIKATIHDETIAGVQRRTTDLKPFYEAAGETMVGSVMKNFDEQGRPQRWKPLAEATLLGGAGFRGLRTTQRGSATKGYERHLRGKQILVTRGMLKNSIKKEATAQHAVVGSNLKYAALHNFGGQAGRGLKVFVPARPFIVAQDEDKAELHGLLRKWVLVGQ
jgi:phage virion morphogenesis protein